MITLLVDEAYAFDFLAILEVKYSFSKNASILEKIEECKKHISDQIGNDLFHTIISSQEYALVLKANKNTFDLVDKAKTDDCKASDVDRSNYYRCEARNNLQKRFFENKISEVKFGYYKYENNNSNNGCQQ